MLPFTDRRFLCSTIEQLLPVFLQLLKDEFPEVRLNVIPKLENVNKSEYQRRPLLF